MKEIDLKGKGLGSYDFSFYKEGNGERNIFLKDISHLEDPIAARVLYEVEPTKQKPKDSSFGFWLSRQDLHEASFMIENFGIDLASFSYFSELDGINKTRALSDHIYCERTTDLVPVVSILAMDVFLQSGGIANLKHLKDVDPINEMYTQKAMLVHFLEGELPVKPEVIVCKITGDGKEYIYSFYFSTKETYPTHIGIKLSPREDESGYLAVSPKNGEIISFKF